MKVCCNTEVFSTAMLLRSLEQLLREVSILRSLHNNSTMLILKALKLGCLTFFLISSTNYIL